MKNTSQSKSPSQALPTFQFLLLIAVFLTACLFALPRLAEAQAVPQAGGDKTTTVEVEFAKGELAYAQKEYAQAQKHFRSLIARYPDASRAHFYLALTHLQLSQLPQAREHFKIVTEIAKPKELAVEAQKYLEDLRIKETGEDEKAKPYAFNFSTGYRYDSNLLLNPDGIAFVSNQNDHAWDAYVRAAVFPVQTERFLLGADYSFYNSYYFDHEGFSFNQHRVSVTALAKTGPLTTLFQPSYAAMFMDRGRDRYLLLTELPLTLRLDYATYFASEFYYRFEYREFSNVGAPDLNITNSFLKDGLAHFPGFAQTLFFQERKGFAKIGFEFPVENARNPYDAAGPKVYGSLRVALPADASMDIFGSYMAKYYFNDYKADIGFVPNGINRNDDVIEAGVSLKKMLWKTLWAQGGYQFLNNNSNEIVYDTKNHMAMFFVGFDL